MKLTFTQIRYKNILSTGNAMTHMDLNSSPTTLILGHNGAGKTTFLDAISFGLYGRPLRNITKAQLINSRNKKDLLVEVDFDLGNSKFTVRRGIKPNIFEIMKDGELVNQAASVKDQQAYLEENIIKMSLKAFSQIVVLGNTDYVSFMSLTAKDRRTFIENLLDIQVFSRMNEILKIKISENKSEILDTEHQLELIKNDIRHAKEYNADIDKIRSDESKELERQGKETVQSIEEDKKLIEDCQQKINEFYDSIDDKEHVISKLRKYNDFCAEARRQISQLSKTKEFFEENEICPTCKQEIEEAFTKEIVENNVSKIDKIEIKLQDVETKKSELETRQEEIECVESSIKKQNDQIRDANTRLQIGKNTLKILKEKLTAKKSEHAKSKKKDVKEFEDKADALEKSISELHVVKNDNSIILKLLKDDGIKGMVVKQYIPIINKLINAYLSEMDMFIEFNFDENFKETIKARYRDEFSYSNFSEGEKLRIDLALLFTWRDVSKMKNPVTTNLLIMDEILDSSLDTKGTEEFLHIIKQFGSGTSLFIISHKGQEIVDNFDQVIEFKKVKGFSEKL